MIMTYSIEIYIKKHRNPFVKTIVDSDEMKGIVAILEDKDTIFLNLGSVVINKDIITYIKIDKVEAKL